MTVDLLFSGALGPQPGGAVALLFGAGTEPPVLPITTAPITAFCAAPWRQAAAAGARTSAPWRQAAAAGARTTTPWSAYQRGPRGVLAAPWGVSARLSPSQVQMPWARTAALGVNPGLAWGNARQIGTGWQAAFRGARPLPTRVTQTPWQHGIHAWHTSETGWSPATPRRVDAVAPYGGTAGSHTGVQAPWRRGRGLVSYGQPWTPYTPTPVVETPCYLPDPGDAVTLLLREQLTGLAELIFACRRAALALVPVKRVYMVTNVTSLTRVDTGDNIACLGMSLSLDVDSWAWGFSASLPATALSLIEPNTAGEPVELAALVNGTEFRLIAESLSRERSFGQASIRVQGRGLTAVLDAPYSAFTTFSNTGARTSQQLLDEALPVGWTANWGITSWLVPAGVWSHQGSPATAGVAIAAAAGAYLQPHASLQQVSVLPRYPSAPWAWGSVTPDLELPAAFTVRESIDWVEKARFNGVYVSGTTTGGVLRLVKRTGTAGDVLAQMVTDPLITHADAARQRGTPILSDTGRIAYVTLRVPVNATTQVIRPGQFVRYVEGATARLGLVRSVSVDVGGTEVWQTIRLETHVN